MIEYRIPEHTHHAATKSRLRLRAVLDVVQEILHIQVSPLFCSERLLRIQVTQFNSSEPSERLFEAAIYEGQRANRERLGLSRHPRPRRG